MKLNEKHKEKVQESQDTEDIHSLNNETEDCPAALESHTTSISSPLNFTERESLYAEIEALRRERDLLKKMWI